MRKLCENYAQSLQKLCRNGATAPPRHHPWHRATTPPRHRATGHRTTVPLCHCATDRATARATAPPTVPAPANRATDRATDPAENLARRTRSIWLGPLFKLEDPKPMAVGEKY